MNNYEISLAVQSLPQGPTQPHWLACEKCWLKDPVNCLHISIIQYNRKGQWQNKQFWYLVEKTWQVLLGATHILGSAHPTNACSFQKCPHSKVVLPRSIVNTKTQPNKEEHFFTWAKFAKFILCPRHIKSWSKHALPDLRPWIFYPLHTLITHYIGNTLTFLLLLLLRIWTEPWDYHQYIRICTHGWCRGKQKAKIWIYYTLIYGPMIRSRLGLRASECAFRQPHFELSCQSISYLI